MARNKFAISQIFSRSRDQKSLMAAEDCEVPLRMQTEQVEDKRKVKLEGWKYTLYLGSITSILVLLFNVGFVLWAVQHHDSEYGQGTLFTGDCEKARKTNTGFHLAINILGTALLGASNYGMQCLCAPTRKDIDKAHSQGKWLDIGVPSIRNLLMIPKKKLALWICLVLSSFPLHLVYNSTIFLTIASYQYGVYMVNTPSLNITSSPSLYLPGDVLLAKGANGELHRLENQECISAYATDIQSKYGSLLLVVDGRNGYGTDYVELGSYFSYNPPLDPYNWICSINIYKKSASDPHQCSFYLADIQSHPENWILRNTMNRVRWDHRIKYCLSEKLPEMCKVHYSLSLAILVIALNLTKAVIICGITIALKDIPLLTTGDAVASFMKRPDQTTENKCLPPNRIVHETVNGPWEFKAKPQRWYSSVSSRGWIFCLLFYAISIAICIGLLCHGLYRTKLDRSVIWSIGFGAVSTQTTITANKFPTTLLPNTIIANTPQTIYSMLYFATNRVFTVMPQAAEWSNYALQRKGLRVSTPPKGSQRSTYFLSLPYRYAAPLLTVAAVLHWLISQSLFLVSVETYSTDLKQISSSDVMTCGYSPVAIVSTLSVGGFMFACVVCMGFNRFKSGMPVASSCSLAMSAACHPPVYSDDEREERRYNEYEGSGLEKEADIATLPLQWGVVPVWGEGVQHCTFSSEDVELPQDGFIYE